MLKKTIKRSDGMAMIIVICVMAIVTVLCLALILSASVLMKNSLSTLSREQCRISAVTVSREIENQLSDESSSLYSYIYTNIRSGLWPYYNEDERSHTEAIANREFSLDVPSADLSNKTGDLSVVMHWECDRETAAKLTTDDSLYQTTPLLISVTCSLDGNVCTIDNDFSLTIKTEDIIDEATGEIIGEETHWQWNLNWRE